MRQNKILPSVVPFELERNNWKSLFLLNLLNVKDQGVGILPSERDKVFEKFYRIGTEFTRSTKGTGLGLYLCKRIADFHNASLVVTSNQPSGSIFTFTHNG